MWNLSFINRLLACQGMSRKITHFLRDLRVQLTHDVIKPNVATETLTHTDTDTKDYDVNNTGAIINQDHLVDHLLKLDRRRPEMAVDFPAGMMLLREFPFFSHRST